MENPLDAQIEHEACPEVLGDVLRATLSRASGGIFVQIEICGVLPCPILDFLLFQMQAGSAVL